MTISHGMENMSRLVETTPGNNELRQNRWLCPLLYVFAFALIFSVSFRPDYHIKRSINPYDPASYFAHGCTFGIDRDLDYSNEHAFEFTNAAGNAPSNPIGSGILAAPFVAALYPIDAAHNPSFVNDRNESTHTWTRFAFILSANVYLLLAVFLYTASLRTLAPRIPPWVPFLLVLGSGILYYTLANYLMAHAYEFFIGALALWASIRLYTALQAGHSSASGLAFLCGVAATMTVIVRYNNVNALWLTPTVLLVLHLWRRDMPLQMPLARVCLWGIAGAVLAYIPFMLYCLRFFGAPFPRVGSVYQVSEAMPHATQSAWEQIGVALGRVGNLYPLVFSAEFGILYTNPVVAVGGGCVVGWTTYWLLRRRTIASLFGWIGVVTYLGLSFGVVLYWRTQASDYGFRYLYSVFPLCILGIALFFEWTCRVGGGRTRVVGVGVRGAILGLCLIGFVSAAAFRVNERLTFAHDWPTAMNRFGVRGTATNPDYLYHVAREMTTARAWYAMVAQGYARLVTDGIMDTPFLAARIPARIREGYGAYPMFRGQPRVVHVQGAILLLLWTAAGAAMGRRSQRAAAAPVTSTETPGTGPT